MPAILGGMISYQVGVSIAKTLFPVLGPAGTAGLRILLSALVVAVMLRPWRHWPGWRPAASALPYGLSLGIMNLLFYLALDHLPLGVAVATEFTGPLAVAILGSRRRLDLLWAALMLGGLALLLDPGAALRGSDVIGVALALGAGLFWALYILFGRRTAQRLPGPLATTLGLGVASIAVVPYCAPAMLPALRSPRLLLAALLVAILSSALPYTIEMAVLRRMDARAFAVLMSLEPGLASCSGFLLLGERLSLPRCAGVACVVAASIGSTLGQVRRRDRQRAPLPVPAEG